MPNATIAVCTQPANTASAPCSPLAALCSSLTDTSCTSPNPLTADSLGNYHYYAKIVNAPFTIQIYGPQVAVPLVIRDQFLSGNLVGANLVSPTVTGGTFSTTSSFNNICMVDGTVHTNIASCVTALPTNGGAIYLPAGSYTQALGALTFSNPIRVMCESPFATAITFTGSSDVASSLTTKTRPSEASRTMPHPASRIAP